MINVLLAATSSESFSGASKCLVELAEKLQEDPEFNVVVTMPHHGDLEKILAEKRIRFYVVKEYQSWYRDEGKDNKGYRLKRIANYVSVLKLMRIIRAEKINVVHENAATAYVPALAAKILHVPYIWHLREFMQEDLHISFTDEKYSNRLIDSASQIVAISTPIAESWSRKVQSPITVIHDGIPINEFYSCADKALNTIAIYGRIVPGKGQLLFFQAAALLIHKYHRNLRFLWAGKIEDEDYYHEIVDAIQRCGISDYCSYLGEINNVPNFLDEVGIVCVCSTKEGFGRVTVESMLSSCLVVASNSGANVEIIRDKENGLIFDNTAQGLADALEWALNHEDLCRCIVVNARNEAKEKYSLDADVEKNKAIV
ncbi:glycosyltransferase, family 1 [Bifidobacterium thermophilum]|nr:glycosyltransferase, family 1 [Bifidobacterium thermophilum]